MQEVIFSRWWMWNGRSRSDLQDDFEQQHKFIQLFRIDSSTLQNLPLVIKNNNGIRGHFFIKPIFVT